MDIESDLPFEDWLHDRRLQMGLTQAELAQCVGCALPTIKKIEHGERRPSREIAGLIAGCLGVPPEQWDSFIAAARRGSFIQSSQSDLDSQIRVRQPRPGLIAPTARQAVVRNNLPVSPTPFVDRPRELHEIAERLGRADCRLLSLIGLGGIGKTRLALQAALQQLEEAWEGIYFIPLASVSAPHYIISSIATALELTFNETSDPKERILSYVRNRRVLLVIDNLEHLLEGVAIIEEILQAAPQVKILATSRERLGLQEEWLLAVDGLDLPDNLNDETALQTGAVQLFSQTVQRINSDFKTADHLAGVIEMCRLVEGMPLAIELAAGLLHTLSVEEVAEGVRQNLALLETSVRNIPERHRSLLATFEYSWKLLKPDEQAAVMSLSVFQGGFDLTMARQVAGAAAYLPALVEKSLIQRQVTSRYYIHPMLRKFLWDRLVEAGRDAQIQNSHLQFFVKLAQQAAPQLEGSDQVKWLQLLDWELADLRSAMSWALENDDAEDALIIAVGLTRYWRLRSYWLEGQLWLEQGLDGLHDPLNSLRSEALYSSGTLAWYQGDYAHSEELFKESLKLWEQLGDPFGLSRALNYLGALAWMWGDLEKANDYYERAIAISQGLEDRTYLAHPLNNLALIANLQGDFLRAHELMSQALAIHEEAGDLANTAHTLINLGEIALYLEHNEECKEYYNRGLAIFKDTGFRFGIAWALECLAEAALVENNLVEAGKLSEEALDIFQEISNQRGVATALYGKGCVALRKGKLAEAQSFLLESLEISHQLEETQLITARLEALGWLAQDSGQLDRAARLYAAAGAIRRQAGVVLPPHELRERDRRLASLRETLESEQHQMNWKFGETLSIREAVHYARTLGTEVTSQSSS